MAWFKAMGSSAPAPAPVSVALIPKMTSNTLPIGIASASTEYSSSYQAYKAFNGDDTAGWSSSASATNQWVKYSFAYPVIVTLIEGVSIGTASGIGNSIKFKFQASNDDVTWIDLSEELTQQSGSRWSGTIDLSDNTTAYTNYRVYETNGSTGMVCNKFQLYGYNPAGVGPLLPNMTSSNTPAGYEVTNTTSYQSRDAWKSCGGATALSTLNMPNAAVYVTLPGSKVVTQFEYKSDNVGQGIKQFSIYGSNDNETFFQICSDTLLNVNTLQIYEISNSVSYKYYRIDILASYASGSVYLEYWNLNGY